MGPTVIAIAPMGDTPAEMVALLVPYVQEAFGAEVVVAPRLALPSSAYDARRRQHRSTLVLDTLAASRRPPWTYLLGVAEVDPYVPELNFVFGEGDPGRRVAVFSLARLRGGSEGAERLPRRAATEAIHELGHAWGLDHRRDPRCVMWFSNTLAESDRKGTRFCAMHAALVRRR